MNNFSEMACVNTLYHVIHMIKYIYTNRISLLTIHENCRDALAQSGAI